MAKNETNNSITEQENNVEQEINELVTEHEINRFVNYCRNHFNLAEIAAQRNYGSLPLCILDVAFCSGGNDYAIARNATQQYADNFLNGDRFAPGHTLSDFIAEYERLYNPEIFTDRYLGRRNRMADGRFKVEACYDLAVSFYNLGINDIEGFQMYKENNENNEEELENIITSIPGFGIGTVYNLFSLCGDSSKVIPSTPINRCTEHIFGRRLTNDEIQDLFTETVEILRREYPELTVSKLDHAIWTIWRRIRNND